MNAWGNSIPYKPCVAKSYLQETRDETRHVQFALAHVMKYWPQNCFAFRKNEK